MHKFLYYLFAALVFSAAVSISRSCDLCGCYTPQIETVTQASSQAASGQPSPSAGESGWLSHAYFAVAEQFTHFGTLQIDGREVANSAGQYLDSSITQLVPGYSITSRFALQLNVPLVYRSFERTEGFAIDRGTESGLGDISLLGKFVVFRKEAGGGRSVAFDDPKNPRITRTEPSFTVSAVLIGGVKLPTGDTRRLKEEFNEIEVEGAPESGIHGHDLTLGTGSFDGVFGAQTSLRYHGFFFEADAQFMLRSEGAYDYHFADDLSWSGGPGYYLLRRPNALVGVQCAVSGEHKGLDQFRGEPAEDTGITSVFVGPRIVASVGKISGELAAEFPVSIDNTALQVVPDYRLRASVAVRF
jgi:hypothetical protein